MLLGYEEWQNDWWCDDIRRRGIRFGALPLHLAVNESELAAIDDAGISRPAFAAASLSSC